MDKNINIIDWFSIFACDSCNKCNTTKLFYLHHHIILQTMLKLGFVRHAKSSWTSPQLTDHDRPLNKRGERDAPNMAVKVKELFGAPDILISSTANRALTTALFFKKEMRLSDSQLEKKSELYHASLEDSMEIVSEIPEGVQYALIFGHNPTTTYLANSFPGEIIDNVPTCGVIILESTATTWLDLSPSNTTRLDFIYPKMYV